MGKLRATIIDAVEQKLQDTGNAVFTAAEIGAVIDNGALAEIAEYVPYDVRETLTTTAEIKDLSLASITDLMWVKEVEFPISKEPKRLREFSRIGATLTMNINFEPAASESVYVHCAKSHHLDDQWAASSTPALNSFIAPPTQNGFRYECTTSGTVAGAGTAPTLGTVAGGTVADGDAVWTTRAEDSTTFDDPLLTARFIDLVAARTALSKSRSYVTGMTLGNQFADTIKWGEMLLRDTLHQLRGMKEPRINIERLKGR